MERDHVDVVDRSQQLDSQQPPFMLSCTLSLDHVGQVCLNFSSDGLSWSLLEPSDNDDSTCLCIKFASKVTATEIKFSDVYAVELNSYGVIHGPRIPSARKFLKGHFESDAKSYRFTVHGFQSSTTLPSVHVLATYTFGHTDLHICQMWVRYGSRVAAGEANESPESPFYLESPGGLYEFIEQRLKENGHVVIVVAEGAGQEYIAQEMQAAGEKDASGNKLLLDVGLWLTQKIKDHFAKGQQMAVCMKYIDPTYMIRAIPSNASDNIYCTLLAHSTVHGAMAGFTGFTVGPVNSRHAYIPISCVTEKQNTVNLTDRMWARLLASMNQPSFLEIDELQDGLELMNSSIENSSI